VQNSPFLITGHITFSTIYLTFGVLCYKDEPSPLLVCRNLTFSIIFRTTSLRYLTCPSIIFFLFLSHISKS